MKTIPLTQNKVALVDDDDYEHLSQYKWHVRGRYRRNGTSYAQRSEQGKVFQMHHEILNIQKGQMIDHIDGDGLNNQRHNLRIATRFQNAQNARNSNASGYKGISPSRNGQTFSARVSHRKKKYYCGSYPTAKEAAMAYDRKAKELFGEFAWLNFPD